jgi:hypothetical protein
MGNKLSQFLIQLECHVGFISLWSFWRLMFTFGAILSYIFLYWSYEYISGNQQNDIINHAYIFMSWSCERIPNMVSENTFPIYSCAGRMRKYISYIYPRAGRHLEDVDVSFFSMSISRPAKTKPGCNFVFKSTWFPLPKNPSCSGAC